MRKIAGLLLMAVMAWGCGDDDDEKRVGDYELPSDLFYQTKWEGDLNRYDRGGESFWQNKGVNLECFFVSGTRVLMMCDTTYISTESGTAPFDKDDTVSEFSYSVEGKVLHIYNEREQDPTGYWVLTYGNAALDSLVFEREMFDWSKKEVLTLKRKPFEWER